MVIINVIMSGRFRELDPPPGHHFCLPRTSIDQAPGRVAQPLYVLYCTVSSVVRGHHLFPQIPRNHSLQGLHRRIVEMTRPSCPILTPRVQVHPVDHQEQVLFRGCALSSHRMCPLVRGSSIARHVLAVIFVWARGEVTVTLSPPGLCCCHIRLLRHFFLSTLYSLYPYA